MQFVRRLPAVADMTLVTAGAMTANIASYLLQLLAGRWLGVAGYSEFASLLAVQLLCAVPALALQNVVARELVHGSDIAALRALRWRCAVLVAAAVVVLVPVVSVLLDVGVAAAAAALGSAPALVVLAGEQGVLQGQKRFRGLAMVLGATGIAKVVPALVVLALGGGAAAALWAAAGGIAAAAVYGRMVAGPGRAGTAGHHGAPPGVEALGASASQGTTPAPETPRGSGITDTGGDPRSGAGSAISGTGAGAKSGLADVAAVLRAAQVQAALMALSSADLIVVRMVLEEPDASRYALGTIATKIAFWLPQAVGVVLYPRMAQPASSGSAIRSALAVLAGIGVVAVFGAAVAAPLAPLLAGRDYAPIQGLLWLFALHGAILAVLQGALLSAIAVNRTALAALAWVGLAVEVVLMLVVANSVTGLIVTAALVAGATTALVALLVIRAAARRPAVAAT
ncbi:polysaccharide biosynthesis protein [Nocardia carnea]|uniref:polysaccharide biosynthesis protein n=1 Tax=Nocardia carnea TaxID=37328 RepID=UPI00245600FA|nr:polysaccharide biosynthesis protein [Nocardia carnea]